MSQARHKFPTSPSLMTEYSTLQSKERLLPILVPPAMRPLLTEEAAVLGENRGPIARVLLPTRERLDLRAPGEVPDFVEDRSNFVGSTGRIIRKYEDRVLVIATERCAGHCMYCFRQDLLVDGDPDAIIPEVASDLADLLAKDRSIREVILSGGDPLTLPLSRLSTLVQPVVDAGRRVDLRVHTRNFTFSPGTVSDDKLTVLRQANARIVLHVVHPYEMHAGFIERVEASTAAGLRLYAQFPLLRKVNDHVLVLLRLLESLDELNIRPLTIFIADPINYSASFRIPLARVRSLSQELHEASPAWVNSVRFVIDTPVGKVRLSDIPTPVTDGGSVWIERSGEKVSYHDLPSSFDVVGDINSLLWRGFQKDLAF